MPCLIPGRVFHNGRPGTTPDIGRLDYATILSLRQFEVATLRDVPESVFPTGKVWNSDQRLLLYRTPELDLYIPPTELVRHLFLHERVLANTIFRYGALAELWVPVRPHCYDELELNFTAAMPVSVLTTRFVSEFAWLAVHPTGAKSWRSVATLSNKKEGVWLDLPKIENSRIAFIGLIGDGAALVLEVIELPGKRDPVRRLRYTHPSLRKNETRVIGSAQLSGDGKKVRQPDKTDKDFRIEDGASRVSSNPDTAEILRLGDDFVGNRAQIRRRYISTTSDGIGGGSAAYDSSSDDGDDEHDLPPQREIVKVSVADISTSPDLPPLSFRLLEPAPPGYLGELEPLIETLKRMRELLSPTTRFASALCVIPDGKAIFWVGRYRRPCLIATITPRNAPPVVLLEVDHAGDILLSALGLHFAKDIDHEGLEWSVQLVLDAMDGNGHWPSDVERIGRPTFAISRIVRLLRVQSRVDQADYQTRWAVMLIEKLKLQ